MTTVNSATCRSWALIGLGMGLGLGCLTSRPDPNHCANLEGDRTCAERYPGELAFCTACVFTAANDGCVAERPEDGSCYSPCGDGTRFDEDASCLGAGSSSSGEESTETGGTTFGTDTGSGSGESSTTGPMPCVSDEECTNAAAPFCEPVSGECVACDGVEDPDAACAGEDPAAPLCVGGTCVQCTAAAPEACTGKTPVCDEETNTCVPCTAHAECAGGAACNLYIGACLPAGAVVHVGPGQTFGTLGEAISSFGAGAEGTIVVHQADYNEAATVDDGRTLAFLAVEIGAGVEPPRWILAGGGSPQLTVTAGATVLMDGIQLSGNASTTEPGLRVDGGRAWVDRGRIVGNDGGAIVAQAGAELVLRNCFVGGDVSDRNALEMDGAMATVLYSTLGAGFGDAAALVCNPTSTVEVRNSLLVARTDANELQCSRASVEHSAAEADLGATNTTLGTMATTWFADFGGGDFHLAAVPVTVGNTAEWQDGDPTVDIDSEPRPAVDGVPDVAGADVP